MSYPGIERATVAMAYDNGCINRDRPEERLKQDLAKWLALDAGSKFGLTPEQLEQIDAWLAQLENDRIDMLVAGGEDEQEMLLICAPYPGRGGITDLLLTWIFEEVL